MVDILETKIEYLKGVGPMRSEVLNSELGIYTFYDLFNYFPYRYIDRSKILKLSDIQLDSAYVQCVGKITNIDEISTGKRGSNRLIAEFSDGMAIMELVWFQSIKWIKPKLKIGETYVIFGKPQRFGNKISMSHPEIETYNDFIRQPFSEGLQPMYNSTEKLKRLSLDSKGIQKLMKTLVETHIDKFQETLAEYILKDAKIGGLQQAMKQIHFPTNLNEVYQAERRLKFEEIFFFQLNMQISKRLREKTIQGIKFTQVGTLFHDFYNDKLPFQLTNSQKNVIREIWDDCRSGKQMNRLLQGDVGSGKTVVALMAMLLSGGNDYQACLMAPTEILAQQHYKTISNLIENLGVKVELLTGSTKKSKKTEIYNSLKDGSLNFIVGTHALIEDVVEFKNLGLVIIDEQHRFGVAQRARLWQKYKNPPHILVMTATPIPRTLALTTHGDLDISIINEFPFGEKKIKTLHFLETKRLVMYDLVRKQIAEGRQVYFVYPLINESSKLDLKALMEQYEEVSHHFPRPQYSHGIVHGGMSAAEKEEEMQKFRNGINQILVATTVIEVGVDVGNASVMVIENSEHFGLSQLHQLRGRIGRSSHQSYCILMTKNEIGETAQKRIQTMVSTLDGFKISEVDLELRGPGDPEGTQQSGQIPFKLINPAADYKVIKYSNDLVKKILDEDANLESDKNRILVKTLNKIKQSQLFWSRVG